MTQGPRKREASRQARAGVAVEDWPAREGPGPEEGQEKQRFRFVVLSAVWLAGLLLILDRVNISLAAPILMDELRLNGTQMGMILSAFFWGYMLGNPLGGLFADHLGLRRAGTALLVGWCLFTVMTGLCTTPRQFYLVRFLMGLTEGASVPFFQKLQRTWLLPQERGRGYAIFEAFVKLGACIGFPFIGWLITLFAWWGMFFATAALTSLGCIYFYVMIRDSPDGHPWVSAGEKERLREALEQDEVTNAPAAGQAQKASFGENLRQLVGDWAFWLLALLAFLTTSFYFAGMTWLPGYLAKERGYTVMKTGIYLVLPYLGSIAGGIACGYLGDRSGRRSLVGAAFCALGCPALIGAVWVESLTGVVVLLTIALFFAIGALNSLVTLIYDLFPLESFGTRVGLLGGLGGGLSGVISPLLIGFLLDVTGSFFWGFTVIALFTLAGGVNFLLLSAREKNIRQEREARAALSAGVAAGVLQKG
ncbi:MAG: MFS transporter [Nitrospinae bacterium]|nr:MFS transporter [Nitrospinota bacterium]